jgi:hypothetical protein
MDDVTQSCGCQRVCRCEPEGEEPRPECACGCELLTYTERAAGVCGVCSWDAAMARIDWREDAAE